MDKRNHVCLIKPINFEIEGLITLMEKYTNEFERGYFIESIWKFLIYTELAKSIYERIKSKNAYALHRNEINYLSFIEENSSLFLTDFSTRLEEQIEDVLMNYEINNSDRQVDFRIKLSEYLHDNIINEVKNMFADVISKNEKIIVLVDNLDKSWRKDARINILSKYILGLLGVTGRIAKDFAYIKTKQRKIEFNLTIFLRSDIFKNIIEFAREPDKIETTKLKWDDKEILFRIIEERFVSLSEFIVTENELWEKYLVKEVRGVPVKEFIYNIIIPRPRDIIYLFKTAKDYALARGHDRIEEVDLLSSYSEYSAWVFKSLLVENGITIKQLSDFMYQLVGENSTLSIEEVSTKMALSGLDTSDEMVSKFTDHLVTLSILGRQIKEGEFAFEYDYESSEKNKIMANRLEEKRFKINNAIGPYLGLNVLN